MFAGLGFGWLCGWGISRAARWLKDSSEQPVVTEGLFQLGMIGLSYGKKQGDGKSKGTQLISNQLAASR